MRQYQGIAAPPPALDVPAAVPEFFAAYAPSWFPRRFGEQTYGARPPAFETLPAPEFSWDAIYPDSFPPRYPWQPPIPEPPAFEQLEVPAYSWAAYYPDRLFRPPANPDHFTQNIEPIANPAPDYSWRAYYPDALHRPRALVEYPQAVMNLDPIPIPVPDMTFSVYPDSFPPRYPEHPFQAFTVGAKFGPFAEVRRGLYERHGLYQAPDASSLEPYASVNTVNGQSISHNTETELQFNSSVSTSVQDPYGMVDLFNNKVVIKHTGFYLVQVLTNWASNSTGGRRSIVNVYNSTDVAQFRVIDDERQAFLESRASSSSAIYRFQAGWYLKWSVVQTSGGPLNHAPGILTVIRVAKTNITTVIR